MTIDINKYKDAFFRESKTLINIMNISLLELEKKPDQEKFLFDIYRTVHTLKSLAATLNYQITMELCHTMEDLLESVKNNNIKLVNCIDMLFKCFDFLTNNIKELEENKAELNSDHLINELKHLMINGSYYKNEMNQNNQMVSINSERIKAIEVKVERMDVLINLAEELLISKMRLDVIRETTENTELATAVESLGRLITELQFHVMQIRLVPIAYIFNRFQRMARDLAKQQNKEVNLEIVGGDIEIDRLLIDEMSESISHLIRNAIDHGLETPNIRLEKHKSAQGTIQLSATRSKGFVAIEIKDDGAGLDLMAIKKHAVRLGLLKDTAKNKEITDVIFKGFSTSKTVTEISGRGLGLAIVKQKIESIGGNIRVNSELGKGTSFIIEIPLSLSIIRTLFVMVGQEIYAIPIESVDRLLVAEPNDFKGLMDSEAIIFGNNNIPILRLSNLFNIQARVQEKQPIVVVRKGNERIGIVVDALLTTQEVVIKPLARAVRNNKYFSGAALIGSGEMVLILDIAYLFQEKIKISSAATI